MRDRWGKIAGRLTIVAIIAPLIVAVPTTAHAVTVTEPDCNAIWQRSGSGFYESSPTYTDQRNAAAVWKYSTPEVEGMKSATLNKGVASLAANKSLRSVVVVRHGNITYEAYPNGGGPDKSDNIHSASKSMLQALIGIAVQKGMIGSLDDKVSRYLPTYPNGKQITLRNLLSMRSGLNWTGGKTENKVEKTADWVGAILDQGVTSTPGTKFNYSTGNTHVLSGVLQAATGMTTCQFAKQYLFSQIGITPEHWGRDPKGINSGGYNLYMTPREMSRFGLLYLNNGMWDGRQVIPRSTVAEAGTKLSQVDDTFAYSQGWWMRTIAGHTMYFGWGYGGQFLYVIPDLDIVLVTSENTSDNGKNVEIDSGAFIKDYLIPAITRP